jgi:hypothetical protein
MSKEQPCHSVPAFFRVISRESAKSKSVLPSAPASSPEATHNLFGVYCLTRPVSPLTWAMMQTLTVIQGGRK